MLKFMNLVSKIIYSISKFVYLSNTLFEAFIIFWPTNKLTFHEKQSNNKRMPFE